MNTVDAMTAEVPELDWALLKKITERILAEVPGICRVVYDLTPKPIGPSSGSDLTCLALSAGKGSVCQRILCRS